jgi:hypothetical protein
MRVAGDKEGHAYGMEHREMVRDGRLLKVVDAGTVDGANDRISRDCTRRLCNISTSCSAGASVFGR